VLSNFNMARFELDGKTWNSVEHYYHANKFKKIIDIEYLDFFLSQA